MKRIILTATAVGAIMAGAMAQQSTSGTVSKGKTSIGVHAGGNLYSAYGKTYNGSDLANSLNEGFRAGVDIAIPLGAAFYVQPGIDFVTKGAEGTLNNRDLKLNYVEVPVTFVYKPTLGTGSLNLGFGPYLGYGVGGRLKYADGNSKDVVFKDEFDSTVPEELQYRKSDAGANLLVGYNFANNLSLDLKAQLGLKNIAPDRPASAEGQTSYKNIGFGLSVGYRF